MPTYIKGEKLKTTFGQYIRKEYGNEGYKMYRTRYLEIYRYARRAKVKMDVTREAGLSIIREFNNQPQTQTYKVVQASKGVKTHYLEQVDVELRTSSLAERNTSRYDIKLRPEYDPLRTNEQYDQRDASGYFRTVNLNIPDILQLYRDGKITKADVNLLIKSYKATIEYILTGS